MKNKSRFEFDRSRPFIICKSYQEFQKIGTNTRQKDKRNKNIEDLIEVSKAEFDKSSEKKTQNQDIVVPRFQQIPPLIYKPIKIPQNYIRCSINYPVQDQYQLRQSDIYLISELNKQYPLLQQSFLKQEIIELEKRTGRQDISKKNIFNQRNQYLKELKLRRKSFEQKSLNEIGNKIFNYWCNQRKMFNFPLYRPLWRPNQFQIHHISAFRRRQKEKRSLRRYNRMPQEEVIANLIQQFQTANRICQKISERQHIKLRLLHIQQLEWKLNSQGQQFLNKPPESDINQDTRIRNQLLNEMPVSQQQQSSEQIEEEQVFKNKLKACKFIKSILQSQKDELEEGKSVFPFRLRTHQSYAERFNKFKDLNSSQYEFQNEDYYLHKQNVRTQYYSSQDRTMDIKNPIGRFNNKKNQNE